MVRICRSDNGMTFEPFVAKMFALYCDRVKAMECWKEKAHFSERDFTRPLLQDPKRLRMNFRFVSTFVVDINRKFL